MKRYFITGTDTDCGKTYVTSRMLDWLNSRQQKAQGLKPLASGGIEKEGGLIYEDISCLQRHNYNPQQPINFKCYVPPISPHIAAKMVDDRLLAAELADFCTDPEYSVYDHLLIEGAGGLMVPFGNQETWLDFLQLTKIPVLLVVGMRLGCINHALLTDYVLKSHNIPCLGWIANCIDKNMLVIDENIATLKARLHMPLLATVRYDGGFILEKTVFGRSNPLLHND